jgi:hypothetical protein
MDAQTRKRKPGKTALQSGLCTRLGLRFCSATSRSLSSASARGTSPKKSGGTSKPKTKPSANYLPLGVLTEGFSCADFFGASSVASALDIRLGRDPGANETKLPQGLREARQNRNFLLCSQ